MQIKRETVERENTALSHTLRKNSDFSPTKERQDYVKSSSRKENVQRDKTATLHMGSKS